MVPDLRRFAHREEATPIRDGGTLAEGVVSHHRIDAAFHDHQLFRGWMAGVVAAMPVPDRGARAAAHVAVELAIDGLLLNAGSAAPYDDALEWALPSFDGAWLE